MMGHRIADGLLIVCVVGLSLLSFEGAARLVGFAPGPNLRPLPNNNDQTWSAPDPELGWVNKSGTARSTETGNALMTFSAEGSRISPLLRIKESTPLKVLVVGCSFTQGLGVADDETYSHYLNERFPQIRFENFGTAGYNTLQSTMMAERVLARWDTDSVQPVMIIYGLISDHLRRNVGKFRASLTDSRGRYYISPPHARLNGKGLDLYPYRESEPWPFERMSISVSVLHKAWIRYGYDISASEAQEVTRRLIERFNQITLAHGARPLVAVLKRDRPLEDLSRPGVTEVLDCSHPGYGTNPALQTGGTTGHPSAELHRHFADCIGDWIDRHLDELSS